MIRFDATDGMGGRQTPCGLQQLGRTIGGYAVL